MRAPDPGARLREWLRRAAERAARSGAWRCVGCSDCSAELVLARRNVTMNVAPWFCSLWISIVPPCASTIWRTSARPMPAPCVRSE